MSPDEIAAILDEPQLKRLSGAILALDLKYVAAAQEGPNTIRGLVARVRELEAAIHWARMELGDHSGGCECKLCQTLGPTRRDA